MYVVSTVALNLYSSSSSPLPRLHLTAAAHPPDGRDDLPPAAGHYKGAGMLPVSAQVLLLLLLATLLPCAATLPTLSMTTRTKRLAIHPSQWSQHLWPGGVVPYEIAPHYDEWERSVILSAMAEFPKHTCISFRPRTANDRYYLAINKYYNLERCFSYIGRQTTSLFRTREGNIETQMRLDPSCLRFNGRGTVMHELMHIIGFYHEHQRDDRDPRVSGSATHYNYKIYPRSTTYYMGNYDPTSIMHYNFPGIVYPRSYFSVSDILRINTLYRCPKKAAPVATTMSTTTTRRWPVYTTATANVMATTSSPSSPHRQIWTRVYYWPSTRPISATAPTTRVPQWNTSTTRKTVKWPTTARPAWSTVWTSRPPPASFSRRPTATTPATPAPPAPPSDEEQISRNGILRRMRRL